MPQDKINPNLGTQISELIDQAVKNALTQTLEEINSEIVLKHRRIIFDNGMCRDCGNYDEDCNCELFNQGLNTALQIINRHLEEK